MIGVFAGGHGYSFPAPRAGVDSRRPGRVMVFAEDDFMTALTRNGRRGGGKTVAIAAIAIDRRLSDSNN